MKNYQCRKCGLVLQKESTPNSTGCNVSTSHSWHLLGEVGDDNYHCKKCGALVKSKGKPASGGCPESGDHRWQKM